VLTNQNSSIFLFNAEGIVLDDDVYRLYISIRSRDIRGQSRKLSLNALNFRRLLPPPKSCTSVITPT